jgi:hypothetical protein
VVNGRMIAELMNTGARSVVLKVTVFIQACPDGKW